MSGPTNRWYLPVIPRTVWILGWVSLLMDFSSEMIHAVLPILLVTNLGASVLTLGLIEGLAEATAMMVKVFSGAISDWIGKRKPLLLLGYGLAALSKPLFPLAHSPALLLSARLLDRVGKGIRGAPRDALIADVTPSNIRGASFGLRQSMDNAGAILGPLTAFLLMVLLSNDAVKVAWFAIIPALLCVLIIIVLVRDPNAGQSTTFKQPLQLQSYRSLHKNYWHLVVIGALMALARFSEAFLILRALEVGFSLATAPLVMVAMTGAYFLTAYPAGHYSDRIPRQTLLLLSMLLLVIADTFLLSTSSPALMLVGVVFWGMHMGFSQGVLAAMVADVAPASIRATAFGIFNLIVGLFVLLASVLAGVLWDVYGSQATFMAAIGIAVISMGVMLKLSGQTTPPSTD